MKICTEKGVEQFNMTLKIGLVHATMNSVQPSLNAFHSMYPEIELVNVMDESLIKELNETNIITNDMVKRLIDITTKAERANVDAILFTCSSFSPYIPNIKNLFDVPVLSSDESMLKKAVEQGTKISVIATVEKAGPTTTNLLYEMAEQYNKEIEVNTVVLTEAFYALEKGQDNIHDDLIHQEIDKQLKISDSVVLAQYSMARALKAYSNNENNNILTAPEVGVEEVVNLAKHKPSKFS